MDDPTYFKAVNHNAMQTSPENFYHHLRDYLDGHPKSAHQAATELAEKTGISIRAIKYYADPDPDKRLEPKLSPFLLIMSAIGRQVEDFPKES